MTTQDKYITAIVLSNDSKTDMMRDIDSLDADICLESDLPFNSIVIGTNEKQNLEKIRNLSTVSSIDIEGKGSVPKI